MEVTLSIITINYNNAVGLKKTIQSVLNQTNQDFEYIIIDGSSSDGSVSSILEYDYSHLKNFKYVSEKDTGIYNAMNKGIKLSSGKYLQFLNSGDSLFSSDVVERMFVSLNKINDQRLQHSLNPISVMTGNMGLIKDGKKVVWKGPKTTSLSFSTLFLGSVNHSPSYINRELFNKYGLYDENLKIVSDWKFFFETLIMHNEPMEFVDITVTQFDLTGISSVNLELREKERQQVLSTLLPPILLDQLYTMYPVYNKAARVMKSSFMNGFITLIYKILNKIDKIKYGFINK